MSRPSLIAATLAALVLAGPVGAATAQPTANQPPVATADEATVAAGQAVTVPVLANDTDDGLGRPEGEAPRLDVVAVTGDARATFTATDVTVTTGADDAGDIAVDYTVTDGELSATGRLTVHVAPAPARAVTIDLADRVVVLRDHPVTGAVRPATADVSVRVQRRTATGWTTYDRTTTDAQGGYAVTFRTARPGKVKLRVVAVWPDGKRTTSERVTRTVRARADARVSGPLDRGDVPFSWRPGCPVSPAGLREIHVNHWSYSGEVRRGVVVARAGHTRAIVKVLTAAFDRGFPIRRILPADHYYAGGRRTPSGSDQAAMRAGNTSAFNCRPVTGNPYRISQHSYGNAIDINTIENPYVTRSAVYPAGSRRYLDRSPYRRGMIVGAGVVATKMRQLGWAWGARWGHPDYQHFSSNGG